MIWFDGYLTAFRHFALRDAARGPNIWEILAVLGTLISAVAAAYAAIISMRYNRQALAFAVDVARSELVSNAISEHQNASRLVERIADLTQDPNYARFEEDNSDDDFHAWRLDFNEGFLKFKECKKTANSLRDRSSKAKKFGPYR